MAGTEAQEWEQMKQTARAGAASLVADYPDFPNITASAPHLAENFCNLATPTDLNSLFQARIALSALTSGYNHTRDQLNLNRRLGR
jgi:hypothetical protein